MTVIIKNKIPLVVPTVVRRKAGLKSGDKVRFKVSGGIISIVPKLPAEDLEDYLELHDAAVNSQIKQSNNDIRVGKTRPAADLLKDLDKAIRKTCRREF